MPTYSGLAFCGKAQTGARQHRMVGRVEHAAGAEHQRRIADIALQQKRAERAFLRDSASPAARATVSAARVSRLVSPT